MYPIHTTHPIHITPATLTAYKRFLEDDEKTPATIDLYMRGARKFATFLDAHRTKAFTKHDAILYKQSLLDSSYLPRSINAYIAAFNSFLDFLGLGTYRVKSIKIQPNFFVDEEKLLTTYDVEKLIHSKACSPQYRALIQTLAATGLRISELKYVTSEALSTGYIYINSKGKVRIVPLTQELISSLKTYAKHAGIKRGPIFITKKKCPLSRSVIWKALKRIAHTAHVSLKKVFPHNFRKLFARNVYALTHDIAAIANILGHTSVETTRIYIANSTKMYTKHITRLGIIT